MNSSMIQRQCKVNSEILDAMYNQIAGMRVSRRVYFNANEPEQAKLYTPYINKLSKRIKALEQLQKALKEDLQEAYTIEQSFSLRSKMFEKTWEALPQEDDAFWLDRARMAAEDGFVEPGVVLSVVQE